MIINLVGVSDSSTFLGLGPCPMMIKNPHMREAKWGDAYLTLREKKEENTESHCKRNIIDLLMNNSSSNLPEEDFILNLRLLHLY